MKTLPLRSRDDAASGTQCEQDRRLRNDIESAILATGHRCLRHVCVSVQNRLITLRGVVSSYHSKQLAQVAVRAVAGPYELCNEVTVSPG